MQQIHRKYFEDIILLYSEIELLLLEINDQEINLTLSNIKAANEKTHRTTRAHIERQT